MNRLGVLLVSLLLTACAQNITVRSNAQCDGVQQPGEDYVDEPFDFDGDGYFDAQNNDCVEEYGLENLDCDDRLDTTNPGADEILCNGEDDDCDEETLDGGDNDGDGSLACDDCDDEDPDNFPGNDEVCDDGIDNNCDGVADENCEGSDGYTGTWVVPGAISYACAFNSVTINVSSISITDVNPTILFDFSGGTQPGTISGSFTSGTAFTGTNFISSGGGGCDETYTITGSFTSDTSMAGTLSATFTDASGLGACFDCTNQTWQISAVR